MTLAQIAVTIGALSGVAGVVGTGPPEQMAAYPSFFGLLSLLSIAALNFIVSVFPL